MGTAPVRMEKKIPTFCNNCVAGPDLLTVTVRDGVAVGMGPNKAAMEIEPNAGKPCVKAYGLIQKTYNPYRVLQPMKRTNPRKGMNEDPGFVAISWEEALDIITTRLKDIRSRGLVDEQGLPRVAVTLGGAGTPAHYMGTFPAFLAAWGAIDFSYGSGEGVKCVHSEHLYGEYWHRGFTVVPDTPLSRYVISFGHNTEGSGGASAVIRHADARVRGMKRVSVEPHLSVTSACSAQWVPIKPKTDAAFMLGMLHVMLFENERERLDLPFLRDRTASPYLVGPEGFYLRDPESRKPLVWDTRRSAAVPFDTADIEPALEGTFTVASAVEAGPDKDLWTYQDVSGDTAFSRLVDHLKEYTPEWAAKVCDVPAATVRQVANEYLDNACVGQTIEVNGVTLPFRPVGVSLGKTVNNGWGGFECCWGRTMLAVLVGALEVPGGTIGSTVRLNKPHENRLKSVRPGPDGFLFNALNPTDAETWSTKSVSRNLHRMLVPLVLNTGWSQALGPTSLAWLFQEKAPKGWERSLPDMWFLFRTNPPIAFADTERVVDIMKRMPFMVCFAYTLDETNFLADVLLPDATDLESLQLIRMGGTHFDEYFCEHRGFVLRQPVVEPRGGARDFTWISTELARRTGLLQGYLGAINHGVGVGTKLIGKDYNFALPGDKVPTVEEVWDAACKAASVEVSGGKEVKDLAWFKDNGFYAAPYPRTDWYLYPTMVELGLRFELPYQERLMRSGRELERRLHEHDVYWWDEQLTEYMALPAWHDIPGRWIKALEHSGAKPEDYPFWVITTHSMQYAWGSNVAIQLMHEISQNVRGHGGVVINAGAARRLGIADGDMVEISSPVASTYGRAIVVQGIRPDTLLIIGQFNHWITPYAKDLHTPSLNRVAPLSMELTDATGSTADVVLVNVRKVDEKQAELARSRAARLHA